MLLGSVIVPWMTLLMTLETVRGAVSTFAPNVQINSLFRHRSHHRVEAPAGAASTRPQRIRVRVRSTLHV